MTRGLNRIGGVPRDDHFGGSIFAELQVQAAHRLRPALIGPGPQSGSATRRPKQRNAARAEASTDDRGRRAGRQ